MIHSIHQIIRWCMWSTTLTRTWWSGISSSFSLSYLHGQWSTTKQEAYGVYYAVTKWNYYLQGAEVIIHNDHKPLARFLNGKNTNNKVNRWGLELATYSITFKWISEAKNKAADCLSRLVELPHDSQASVQMLTATNHDGPTFSTRSRAAECNITEDLTSQPKADTVAPDVTIVTDMPDVTPKPLMEDRLHALLQMPNIDPFCKHISKCLSNGKAPKHEADVFLHIKWLLYKHVTVQTISSWALSYLKLGSTQFSWKHMTKWSLRSYSYILPCKMTILLKRHEQGHQKIHS